MVLLAKLWYTIAVRLKVEVYRKLVYSKLKYLQDFRSVQHEKICYHMFIEGRFVNEKGNVVK